MIVRPRLVVAHVYENSELGGVRTTCLADSFPSLLPQVMAGVAIIVPVLVSKKRLTHGAVREFDLPGSSKRSSHPVDGVASPDFSLNKSTARYVLQKDPTGSR
jgi:hypothetical protein